MTQIEWQNATKKLQEFTRIAFWKRKDLEDNRKQSRDAYKAWSCNTLILCVNDQNHEFNCQKNVKTYHS